MIVDPWGVVLATAPDARGHIVAELDFARLDEIRATLPVARHTAAPAAYAAGPLEAAA